MTPQDVFMVFGPTDADDLTVRPLEVYLGQDQAAKYLLRGLDEVFLTHSLMLEPGGTCSLLVSRSPDGARVPVSASFAVNNIVEGKADRHVWEFHVEKRAAR